MLVKFFGNGSNHAWSVSQWSEWLTPWLAFVFSDTGQDYGLFMMANVIDPMVRSIIVIVLGFGPITVTVTPGEGPPPSS